MANCNTLLALAYIRESDNPLKVVSNLILYCLHNSPDGESSYDDLKIKMNENFGIHIPHHVIDCCLKYLLKSEKIIKLPHGAGYRIISSSFNVEQFYRDKSVLSLEEDLFATSICDYVKKNYRLIWDKNKAIDCFTKLVLMENFSETVLEKSIDDEKPGYISETWYVKKYIMYLLENKKDDNYSYFLKVFNGKIVLTGLTQISNYTQNRNQKFRGTIFYLDTKIMLRVLGFSAPFYTEASLELVRLIQSEYEGVICVFEHVVQEIKYALSLAYHDLLEGESIYNYELDYYRKMHNYSADDFKIASDSIEKRITDDFHFRLVPSIDWNSTPTKQYCIDTENLHHFIANANPEWSDKAIKNDVYAIVAVNAERKNDYSINYGGKNKLPILVTSNNKLVSDVKQYTFDCIKKSISLPWMPNKLPLINDYDLTCRLWLTSSNKEDISLNLIKSAYLYQQSDAVFYEKIRSTYDDVKKKHKYDIIDLDYERFEKLKELIVNNICGNIDDITDEVVAISFEELARRQSSDKDEMIRNLENKNKNEEQKNNNLANQIVVSASSRFINNVDKSCRLSCWIIKNLPWIIGVFSSIVVFVIDCFISNDALGRSILWSFIPFIISVVFLIIDKKVLKDSIIEKWLKKYKQKCKLKYEQTIIDNLLVHEMEYKERIIMNCIDHTSFFCE